MYRSWFLLCNSQTHYLYVSADDRSSLCTYISDDSQFLYVGGLCVQQLPYRLLLVELSPCQCLQTKKKYIPRFLLSQLMEIKRKNINKYFFKFIETLNIYDLSLCNGCFMAVRLEAKTKPNLD